MASPKDVGGKISHAFDLMINRPYHFLSVIWKFLERRLILTSIRWGFQRDSVGGGRTLDGLRDSSSN